MQISLRPFAPLCLRGEVYFTHARSRAHLDHPLRKYPQENLISFRAQTDTRYYLLL